MIIARRFALRPNTEQARALGRAAGCARWAYNWAIGLQRAALGNGERLPSAVDLHKELNRLKKAPVEDGGVPWMYEVSKCAPQEALRDAEDAWRRCFKHLARRPQFHKRSDGGHFRLTGSIRVEEGAIRLPRIGAVRIMPGDRDWAPSGEFMVVSVTEVAGQWFASVKIEVPEADLRAGAVVGIDVGVRDLAHLSNGTVYANPRALAKEARRLRHVKRSIARKQRAADTAHGPRKKGERRTDSQRLKRERKRAARLLARVANIRRDALHKATTEIARNYATVVVEDLRVKNMTRRRRGKGRAAKAGLNRAILDSGLGQIRRLLEYKMPLHGGKLIVVPAAYTSKTCSRCGSRNDPGASKCYQCESCALVLDRDRNASLNILAAASWTEATNAHGETIRSPSLGSEARPSEVRIETVA